MRYTRFTQLRAAALNWLCIEPPQYTLCNWLANVSNITTHLYLGIFTGLYYFYISLKFLTEQTSISHWYLMTFWQSPNGKKYMSPTHLDKKNWIPKMEIRELYIMQIEIFKKGITGVQTQLYRAWHDSNQDIRILMW